MPGRTGFNEYAKMFEATKAKISVFNNSAKAYLKDALSDDKAMSDQIGAVVSLILVGIVFYIGLAISSGVVDAVDLNNTSFAGAAQSITTGISSAYSMGAVLLIVMIAGAIIYTLLRSFGFFMGPRTQ